MLIYNSYIGKPFSLLGYCTFEFDLCGWTQDTSEALDWSRSTGTNTFPGNAPDSDHTTGSPTGKVVQRSNIVYHDVVI